MIYDDSLQVQDQDNAEVDDQPEQLRFSLHENPSDLAINNAGVTEMVKVNMQHPSGNCGMWETMHNSMYESLCKSLRGEELNEDAILDHVGYIHQ